MGYGEMVTITQTLSDEAIEVLAADFSRQVEITHAADEEAELEKEAVDDPKDLKPRAAVITVMGHVDHGKTSLLDAIRDTAVAAGEAGGITQHIGAYQVKHDGQQITFIDTPGHAAFTAMRARGAKVTDIAAIVVAADDGVMPQTVEAIDHAKAAGVPIVIVVNKIDKPEANVDRLKQQLSEQGIIPEEWGGDTVFVEASAKKRIGLDNFLDMLLLVAEVADLKANPDAPASGFVIESRVDPGRGVVATILINRGTMHVGDAIVAGEASGRVRAMRDFKARPLKSAGPSTPVEIVGFDELPVAGEFCRVVKDERMARSLGQKRANRLRTEALAKQRALTLDDVFARIAEGKVLDLNLVVKADVQGSLEALSDALLKIQHPEVKVRVIHSGVGGINENDVMLASASDGDHHRLQRAPEPRRHRAGRERGRRRAHLSRHLQGHRGHHRRAGGHAQADDRGGRARPGRGAHDVQGVQARHHRRLHGHARHDHAQRQRARAAQRRRRARRQDELPQALRGRRARGSGRVRVRHPARRLQRPQGRGRAGGVRDQRSRP